MSMVVFTLVFSGLCYCNIMKVKGSVLGNECTLLHVTELLSFLLITPLILLLGEVTCGNSSEKMGFRSGEGCDA